MQLRPPATSKTAWVPGTTNSLHGRIQLRMRVRIRTLRIIPERSDSGSLRSNIRH
jgi:hypothetical protein